jgi:FixJ family two-component response regulator
MSSPGVVHIVDDDGPYRAALTRLLAAAGFEVCAFPSGGELLAQLSPAASGCVLADLRMPGMNGLELQAALARVGVSLPMVFLTGQGDVPSAVHAIQQGALDFLDKRAPLEQLTAAINRALERDGLARAARALQDRLRQRFASLTERERQVLRQVVCGKMNKAIAAELGIHERTVKLHRTAITAKVGVRSVAQLTTLVRDARLWEVPETPFPSGQ